MPISFLGRHGHNGTAKDYETIYTPGQPGVYRLCGVAFNMHYVPGGLTFPADSVANSFRDDTSATVANPYWITNTALTYRLWSAVYAWAISHGYTFANPGSAGGYTDDYGDTLKAFDPGHESDPVTAINWRDAIVWCNALTEYYFWENGINLDCVYLDSSGVPLRDSQNSICDQLTDVINSAKGFRLPSGREWELAARYQNGSDWTPGNHVSGDATGYCYPTDTDGSMEFGKYAWYLGNCNILGPNIFSAGPVGEKAPNTLGLYDLSGNVWEWCFDLYNDSLRMVRGGSWCDGADCLRLGLLSGENPADTDYNLGFRIVRSG